MFTVFLLIIIFIPLIILFMILYFTGIVMLIPGRILQKAHEKMKQEPPIEYEIIDDDEEKLP